MENKSRIHCDDNQEVAALVGSLQFNSNLIADQLDVRTVLDNDGLTLIGEPQAIEQANNVYRKLSEMYRQGIDADEQAVRYLIDQARQTGDQEVCEIAYSPDFITINAKGRPIYSKTSGQQKYIKAIDKNDLTFGIGPAGTGKTYLAVAMAVKAFKARRVSRIILTRPAVEAGEKLGFLPGDLQMKVDPYMRPLYDSLYDLMGSDQYRLNLEKGLIEISPLAYMRGRTLDDAFIILDEAQNTTREQMKMFLTRIGFNSKAVVTGDITQIDLPRDMRSGLKDVPYILRGVEGVKFVKLTAQDVVRNPLVQRIIAAYDQHEHKR